MKRLAVAVLVAIAVASSPAASAAEPCVVSDGALTWGFKESFRSYIYSTIANGEWTVTDGATYETPSFGFANGAGSYDPPSGRGSLAFAGTIEFTGHGGILDTIVANPRVQFVDATTAYLYLDVSGTTQEGAEIAESTVEFARLDLAAAAVEVAGAALRIVDAPATLTADGAHAFGTYPAGEPLDPVTLVFSTDTACPMVLPAPPASPLWWLLAIPVVAAAGGVLLRHRTTPKRAQRGA
jgi:large repetitive protein